MKPREAAPFGPMRFWKITYREIVDGKPAKRAKSVWTQRDKRPEPRLFLDSGRKVYTFKEWTVRWNGTTAIETIMLLSEEFVEKIEEGRESLKYGGIHIVEGLTEEELRGAAV